MAARRSSDARQERTGILEAEEGDPDSQATPKEKNAATSGGYGPCIALAALLVGCAVAGSLVVGLAIAAFDPQHSPARVTNATRGPALTSAALTSTEVESREDKARRAEARGVEAAPSQGQGWGFRSESLPSGAWHVTTSLSWADAVAALSNGTLGPTLNAWLSKSPHEPFYWETPPLTAADAGRTTFEFVTIPAPWLSPEASAHEFGELLAGCSTGARRFPNLGGDAVLVAPCCLRPSGELAHLAAFVRSAATSEQALFWREVGAAISDTLVARGRRPTWVNTEGSGVPWLHVRLDSRPKYYHHAAYRRPPPLAESA